MILAAILVTVELTRNHIVQMTSEAYVAAVVAGEAGTFQSAEARKAMAVAARTYAIRMRGRHGVEGFDFCATTHCQRVETTPSVAAQEAVKATIGELLWFEGRPAFTPYGRDCGGRSEAVSAVWPDISAPYLKANDDPYCTRRGRTPWTWSASPSEIEAALKASHLRCPQPLTNISIAVRTASGRARTLRLNDVLVSATSFRFAIARRLGWNTLRSERYEIDNSPLTFHGYGQGHGVGLCQKGADQMGVEGLDYREILRFYYPGTTLSASGSGLQWTRLGGEHVAIFTTDSNRDRAALRIAETALSQASERLGRNPEGAVEIRIYPNIETFRNATAEPGWVAARTRRGAIEIQPAAVNTATLRHEFLHVLIEQQAAPGLPAWFREGLAEYLSHDTFAPAEGSGDVHNRSSREQAQRGYAQALARVRELVAHYGEPTVTGWLSRGLPDDVKNSSASNPATNSR